MRSRMTSYSFERAAVRESQRPRTRMSVVFFLVVPSFLKGERRRAVSSFCFALCCVQTCCPIVPTFRTTKTMNCLRLREKGSSLLHVSTTFSETTAFVQSLLRNVYTLHVRVVHCCIWLLLQDDGSLPLLSTLLLLCLARIFLCVL